MTLDDAPELLTVDETAALLRIGRRQCYQAVRDGSIPALRIGRTWRVPKARLAALIDPTNDDGAAPDPSAAPSAFHARPRLEVVDER